MHRILIANGIKSRASQGVCPDGEEGTGPLIPTTCFFAFQVICHEETVHPLLRLGYIAMSLDNLYQVIHDHRAQPPRQYLFVANRVSQDWRLQLFAFHGDDDMQVWTGSLDFRQVIQNSI